MSGGVPVRECRASPARSLARAALVVSEATGDRGPAMRTLAVSRRPPGQGRWFLLTVVYDRSAGHARLFVNGGQVAQLASPPVVPLGGRVVVGRAGNDSFLDGMVRDVRVWDTALSNDQVTAGRWWPPAARAGHCCWRW